MPSSSNDSFETPLRAAWDLFMIAVVFCGLTGFVSHGYFVETAKLKGRPEAYNFLTAASSEPLAAPTAPTITNIPQQEYKMTVGCGGKSASVHTPDGPLSNEKLQQLANEYCKQKRE